jgi:hypothetical protein
MRRIFSGVKLLRERDQGFGSARNPHEQEVHSGFCALAVPC